MDRLIWHFEKSGIYKVRTGYKLMAKAGRGEGGGIVAHLAPWWSAVLKLNMKSCENGFAHCGAFETSGHIFFKRGVKVVWKRLGGLMTGDHKPQRSYKFNLIFGVQRDVYEAVFGLLWVLW
ncbi:Hypothetical predicted protein [Olea europaea subsp. europaea]|uniref:Uncharacterized protein n=1 Tax=Olea europaea subsp. europaea TaxID=158383 RepID=A0A8S0QKD5_OLEEU|nr:Hypothetical predicted protein [Olea europaea subsp. europaea]